jgi:hypothetical protein
VRDLIDSDGALIDSSVSERYLSVYDILVGGRGSGDAQSMRFYRPQTLNLP